MKYIIMQDIFYVAVLLGLSILMGNYIHKVMSGQKVFLSPLLAPVEKRFYKLMGMSDHEEMTAKQYTWSIIFFSAAGFIFLFLMLILQGFLPFNP